MIDLKVYALKVFIQVYEQRSFYNAAKTVHRTQPAVSQTIKALEQTLGRHLFDKKKQAQPTQFAKLIYPHIKEYLEHHRQLTVNIEVLKNHGQQNINFAVISSFSMVELPKILQNFQKKYKEVYINVSDTNSKSVQELVSTRKADFGICNLNGAMHEFDICDIAHDSFGIVGHENLLPSALTEIDWQDLIQFQFIKNGSWRILDEDQQSFLDKISLMSISNMISLNTLILSQLGLSILPEKAACFGSNTHIRFIPIINPKLHRSIGLIKLKNSEMSLIATHFYQHVKALYS